MLAMHLTAPYRFEKRDIPAPRADELAEGEVLVRVLVGGICGSDLPYFRGGLGMWTASDPAVRPTGFPLHEIAGEVVASRHEALGIGDMVVGWAPDLLGLAQLVVAYGDELVVVDPAVDLERAIVIQPLACVLYALEQLGDIRGKDVAVIGQGAIGSIFSHAAAQAGATVTAVDRVDRSDKATALGVTTFVHSSSEEWSLALQASGAVGPEIVIEAVGHQVSTLTSAVRAARQSGTVYYFGIPDDPVYPFPINDFIRKNLTLKAGITWDRSRMLALARDYLVRNPELADLLVTDVFPLKNAGEAFANCLVPRIGQLKVLLKYT